MATPGRRQHYRFYVENEKALRGDINTPGLPGTNLPIYRGTQPLSSDQGPVGLGQTASLGSQQGPSGQPQPQAQHDFRAKLQGQQLLPGSCQASEPHVPRSRGPIYLSSGDLGLIPSSVGCPP